MKELSSFKLERNVPNVSNMTSGNVDKNEWTKQIYTDLCKAKSDLNKLEGSVALK